MVNKAWWDLVDITINKSPWASIDKAKRRKCRFSPGIFACDINYRSEHTDASNHLYFVIYQCVVVLYCSLQLLSRLLEWIGETTCFVKPIPECTEEKRLALSNPYQNALRRNNSRFFSMHSGMGLTKQVISPRCILVWVWQSTSFLLDAFWYGFDKASCFSSMHSICFVKPIPECIEEKRLALSNPYQNASRRNILLCRTYTRMHRGETTCFVKPIPECIEEKQLALFNPY
jgi:hypothetical protein